MDSNSKSAVIGGTFFSSIVHIGAEDFVTTIILAIVGAIFSYLASITLKYLHKRISIRFKKNDKKGFI